MDGHSLFSAPLEGPAHRLPVLWVVRVCLRTDVRFRRLRLPVPFFPITISVISDYPCRYFRSSVPTSASDDWLMASNMRSHGSVETRSSRNHDCRYCSQRARPKGPPARDVPLRTQQTTRRRRAGDAQATRSRRADTLRSPDTPASVDAARHGISAGHCECGVCTRWPVGSIVATLPVRLLSRRCTLHTCATLPWRQSGRCGRPAPSSLRTPRRVLADHIGNTPPNAPCSAGIS
jgi:hypothetical protein